VDVKLAFSGFAYNGGTQIFSFNTTVTNLLNQAMGTTDGTNPTSDSVRVFFTDMYVVAGVGTVTVNNADGTAYITQAQPQSYFKYGAPLSPGSTSASKNWQLLIGGTVTRFAFTVEVTAALPAEGSIRRWVSLLGPGVTNDSLTGIWMRSASEVYAVGVSGGVLQYNGTTWSSPTTQTATYYAVSGASGAPTAQVWAVGASGAALYDSAGTWSTPATGTSNALYGVWVAPSGTVFAVGASSTLLMRQNGSWSTMTAPVGSTQMNAVFGIDTAHVWAVGAGGAIWFYNGTSWAAQTSHTTNNLTAVWGDATSDVFAVGAGGTVDHYNGSTWGTQTSHTSNNLTGVGGTSSSNIWAVGDKGTIVHNTGSWAVVTSNVGFPLSAVSSGTTTPWAVGAEGSLLSYSGSAWSLSSQSGLTLTSVWASSANDVWVATLGTALHYNGSSWSSMAVITDDSLMAIYGGGASDTIYAGGKKSTMARYNGSTWSSSSVDNAAYSIWMLDNDSAFVGSSGGNYYMFTSPSNYTGAQVDNSPKLNGVWGSAANNIYVAASNSGGTSGLVYHANGSSITNSPMTIPGGTGPLNAISGSSASDIYAAGGSGAIIHYNGTAWAAMTSGTANTLRGVWADSPPNGYTADAYAVGDNATVQHYNGSAWLNMPTPSGTSNLRAVFGTSSSNVYAVGDLGVVLLGTQ
jgi:hypothetical protein